MSVEGEDIGNIIAIGETIALVGLPTAAASLISAENPSEDGVMHPIRTLDIAGLHDVFNHTGNCWNGATAAAGVIITSSILLERLPGVKKEHPAAVAVGGASVATAVNVAYEAGVSMPPFPDRPNNNFDMADAATGSLSGILFAAVYCALALHQKAKLRHDKRTQ